MARDNDLVRFEIKYLLHPARVAAVRAHIASCCHGDVHACGDPPVYHNFTLQFDTDDLSFLRAKHNEAIDRFKLRARWHEADDPVVVEIKRKLGRSIHKSRAFLPRAWCREHPGLNGPLATTGLSDPLQRDNFLRFQDLRRRTGARPVLVVAYRREAWTGSAEHYARATLDTRLCYRPARGADPYRIGGPWFPCDPPSADDPASSVILELKFTGRMPVWMRDLVVRHGLSATGVCKYALAVAREHRLAPRGRLDLVA